VDVCVAQAIIQNVDHKLQDNYGSFVDPELVAIIQIGLLAYFTKSTPDFPKCFPERYSSTQHLSLINQ
jgi:hypothetical protein